MTVIRELVDAINNGDADAIVGVLAGWRVRRAGVLRRVQRTIVPLPAGRRRTTCPCVDIDHGRVGSRGRADVVPTTRARRRQWVPLPFRQRGGWLRHLRRAHPLAHVVTGTRRRVAVQSAGTGTDMVWSVGDHSTGGPEPPAAPTRARLRRPRSVGGLARAHQPRRGRPIPQPAFRTFRQQL